MGEVLKLLQFLEEKCLIKAEKEVQYATYGKKSGGET
jgi:hypothetical protein